MKLLNAEIRIENSSICNARCCYCPREKLTRKQTTLPNFHFFELVNQAKELGAELISIFGYGEPLLDSGVSMKVKYVTHSGLMSFITTNAVFLTQGRCWSLLDSGLSRIRISVHSIHEDEYELIHKGLRFHEVMQNIDNLLEMKTKHNFDCIIDINCIPLLFIDFQEVITFWESKGIDNLEIWKPHNWAYGRNYRKGIVRKKTCGRPFNGPVQINADGTMMVCCFDFDSKMTVGNTYEHTIENILKSDAFENIREKHLSGDLSGLPCELCDQLYEGDNPLIYSSIDNEINKSYATKTLLGD